MTSKTNIKRVYPKKFPPPPKFAREIFNGLYDPNDSNILETLVNEFLAYAPNFPKTTIELQMKALIQNKLNGIDEGKIKKEPVRSKIKRKRENDETYHFALSCIPHYQSSDVGWKTGLAVELQHQFPKLKFITAKSIVDEAFREYEKIKDKGKEPTFKPTEKSISKVESIPSTSVETQVESQEEIDSRLYSFALNFLFNYQDPGQKILRSELIKTITDYIEHHSLQYTEVPKLADKAISEFREKSKTKPEFKTAYQELYKSEEKTALKPIQSHDSRIETTKEQEIDSVSSSKIDTKSDVRHDETLPQGTTSKKSKIDENHIFILKNIRHVEYSALLVDSFIQKTKKSRATFFRKMNQLEKWGLIVHVNQGTPRHYRLHPKLLNSSLKFLVVDKGTSLTFESMSQTAPIDEKPALDQSSKSQVDAPSVSISAAAETEPCTSETRYDMMSKIAPISEQADLVQHSKSQSQSHFEEIPSDSKYLGGTSETRYDMTSKTASFPEKREERKDPSENPCAKAVSSSPDHEKLREKHETEPETTSKTPSFEELVANFDLRNIRSHDYLYICTIKRAPDDFRQQLADTNWLESKEGMNNWTWYRGSEKLHNIQCHYHIYTRKVTIQLLEVSSPDPFANNAIADDIAVQMTAYLEDQYPGLVLYDLKRRSRLEVKKLHHAIPNHPIAIRAFELSYTSTGRRFGMDDSKGNKEFEAHAHKYSTEDIDNYIEDCDYMAINDRWIRNMDQELHHSQGIQYETAKTLKETNGIVNQVIDNQLKTIGGMLGRDQIMEASLQSNSDLLKQNTSLLEQNLAFREKITVIEKKIDASQEDIVPSIDKTVPREGEFILETKMFDPSLTLVQRLALIVDKNRGISRKQLITGFGWKEGSVGPTLGRLAKKVNLREDEHRRLFLSD